MAYTPRFLLPSQIGAESGGKQFDASGKPLTSSKGAIGIGQVMPETGPEAAKLAGVPWDENRYKTDRDYNLQIADAYQGHLNQTFNGDQIAATAAYNAGPGRIASLKEKYGANWHSYMPTETKKYVKNVLGVNVDQAGGYYNRTDPIGQIGQNLDIALTDTTPGKPTEGESSQVRLGAEIASGTKPADTTAVNKAAAKASTSSDRYTQFLNDAITPIVQNLAAQTQGYKQVAAVKTGLAQDFKMRETDLESKIQPLLAKRAELSGQIQELDNLHPLDRRLKAIFNPTRYDPRMLRGQLERVEQRISTLDSNYSELNKLRSGVAAATVDATAADIGVLDAGRQSTLAEASLLGQVAGATREQVSAAMLPIQAAAETMSLEQHQRASMLGRMTTEMTHQLFNQAAASPDGTVEVQGIKFTTGDLQHVDKENQQVDLSLHNLVNASRINDIMTADKVEDEAISHMSLEQVSDALANNGTFRGVKLDMGKLVAGMAALQEGRNQQVNRVIAGTAAGQATDAFRLQQQLMSGTRGKAQEMFGNMPGDWSQFEQSVSSFATQWTKGLNDAKAKGVGEEYIVQTMPQIQAMRGEYDKRVDAIATRWGGGNTSMKDVASAYLRGDPLNGDAAIKGLISIARSGMPAGAKLTGPAAQAVEMARSIVREFDHPQAGDSMQALLAPNRSQADKDRDLMDRVRTQVGAVYANSLTDSLLNSFPSLARQIRDPNDPSKMHPFARVSQDDFRMAIAHGDNSGYEVLGNQMGVSAQSAKIIFQKGVDSAEWQNVAKQKGWTNDKFGEFMGALQSIQMSETLSALDASHSSHPGFSAAKAYSDFLQTPEVQDRLDKAVQGYGHSNFGAFLVSGAAGGGYRDSWNAYTQAVANQYFLNHGKDLQQKIQQARQIGGDPWTKFNAINRAAGLNPQESQYLISHIKPVASMVDVSDAELMGMRNPNQAQAITTRNFDQITSVVRNHKLDDPQAEHLRKKVAAQWDAMDALVGTVFDSVSNR